MIQSLRFDDLKTALFCHLYQRYLMIKAEDLKALNIQISHSKHCFMCQEPQFDTPLIKSSKKSFNN